MAVAEKGLDHYSFYRFLGVKTVSRRELCRRLTESSVHREDTISDLGILDKCASPLLDYEASFPLLATLSISGRPLFGDERTAS